MTEHAAGALDVVEAFLDASSAIDFDTALDVGTAATIHGPGAA